MSSHKAKQSSWNGMSDILCFAASNNDDRVLYHYISVAIWDLGRDASVAMPVRGLSCECSSGIIIVTLFSASF